MQASNALPVNFTVIQQLKYIGINRGCGYLRSMKYITPNTNPTFMRIFNGRNQ